jgi:hypothetical protein
MTYRTDDNHEPESVRRITERQRETTKVAYRPSKRQRMLTSRKADDLAGREDRLYRGEDLARGRR